LDRLDETDSTGTKGTVGLPDARKSVAKSFPEDFACLNSYGKIRAPDLVAFERGRGGES